jgi:hypothetical protein
MTKTARPKQLSQTLVTILSTRADSPLFERGLRPRNLFLGEGLGGGRRGPLPILYGWYAIR